MRIISVNPGAVALVFAVMYAFFGFVPFTAYAFSSVPTFLLPIGILMGVFHLVFNIQLVRSHDLLANALLCLSAMLCYGLTGCITGGVAALCFNFVAEKMGGIDAKFVSVVGDDSAGGTATKPNRHGILGDSQFEAISHDLRSSVLDVEDSSWRIGLGL